MNEIKSCIVYLLEQFLFMYYESMEITYDSDRGAWYSRDKCDYLSIDEFKGLVQDCIIDVMRSYHQRG